MRLIPPTLTPTQALAPFAVGVGLALMGAPWWSPLVAGAVFLGLYEVTRRR